MHLRIFASVQAIVRTALGSRIFLGTAVVLLATAFFCSTAKLAPPALQAARQNKLHDAPELVGGVHWFNTDKPIKLEDLRGRIVLLDFWTLCCINCIHTLPDLAVIEARYPGMVVVIGVHTPKFENEKKTESVRKAILRYEIAHPVISDADKKIWHTYGVNCWPTLVLIDPDGKFRGAAQGEGHLAIVERDIKALIKEFAAKGTLKKTPLPFKKITETATSPLHFPGRVLADAASKRIFISDSTNHRIVITDLSGKKIAVAGSGKEGLKDGPFADAQFSDPQGLALDNAGDILYVADRKNHSIRALDLKKETVTRVAGTGVEKPLSALTSAGKSVLNLHPPGTTWAALKKPMSSPWGLLLHNKRLYIAIAGQNQIWYYDPAKATVGIYAGNGNEEVVDGPLKTAGFAQPSGLATDGKHLFIADSESSSIRSVPLPGVRGDVTTVVGVSGPGEHLFNFGDKNGIGRDVRLQHALEVAYLDGKLYVADTYNSKIKMVDPAKKTCDTFVGSPFTLNEPGGLCISAGKIYIADTNNHRIQVVDMKTKEVSTLQLQGVEPVRRDTASRAP